MLAKVHAEQLARGETEARASEIAWGVVKKSYYKRGGKWHRRKRRNPSGRAVKRAPLRVRQLRAVSEHGRVVALVVEEHDGVTRRYAFKGKLPLLLWSEKYKALLWWEDARDPPREPAEEWLTGPCGKVARAWERFHGITADKVRHVKRSEPAPSSWRRLGHAVSILYRNPERWGPDDADHGFGPRVLVYRAGRLWVVRGGRLRLTSHGIEG